MTKRKKLKGDEYTQYIYPNTSHRVIEDDTNLPDLTSAEKRAMAKPIRELKAWYHLQMRRALHPEESVSPEAAQPEPKKQQSKGNQRRRERRARRSAEKQAQP